MCVILLRVRWRQRLITRKSVSQGNLLRTKWHCDSHLVAKKNTIFPPKISPNNTYNRSYYWTWNMNPNEYQCCSITAECVNEHLFVVIICKCMLCRRGPKLCLSDSVDFGHNKGSCLHMFYFSSLYTKLSKSVTTWNFIFTKHIQWEWYDLLIQRSAT